MKIYISPDRTIVTVTSNSSKTLEHIYHTLESQGAYKVVHNKSVGRVFAFFNNPLGHLNDAVLLVTKS